MPDTHYLRKARTDKSKFHLVSTSRLSEPSKKQFKKGGAMKEIPAQLYFTTTYSICQHKLQK